MQKNRLGNFPTRFIIEPIYDKNRRLTGRTAERGQELEADEYRLIVHVSIMNNQNQLLIQKRHRTSQPGLDFGILALAVVRWQVKRVKRLRRVRLLKN